MAQRIYPVVKEYLANSKQIDKDFVDQYIALYDSYFSGWTKELDHLFTCRYVIADNANDLNYFRRNYRYVSFYLAQTPINQSGLEQVKEKPITKVIAISSDNKNKLGMVKATFPELKNWKYKAHQEFVYTTALKDKTRLIIVNRHSTPLNEILETNFKNRKIE